MKENPEYQEKKEPKESEFKAPEEHETGYTEESWEKPEKAIEEKGSTIDPEYREREEPGARAFKAPGEHETGYTEKSWERPEKTMEEGKEERTRADWETREKESMGYEKEKRLTRSKSDRMVFGVCGGLGKYFGTDPTLIRLGFAFLILLSGIMPGVIIYIIMAIIMPQEDSIK
ncbi:PspC domain-containing protein [Methanosarcina hadiensis]|uniref:PspC domain-containing protein n=1 Tax=Methanosarcina hadiensis TaxID=3078083 RepID=UPI0039776314